MNGEGKIWFDSVLANGAAKRIDRGLDLVHRFVTAFEELVGVLSPPENPPQPEANPKWIDDCCPHDPVAHTLSGCAICDCEVVR